MSVVSAFAAITIFVLGFAAVLATVATVPSLLLGLFVLFRSAMAAKDWKSVPSSQVLLVAAFLFGPSGVAIASLFGMRLAASLAKALL